MSGPENRAKDDAMRAIYISIGAIAMSLVVMVKELVLNRPSSTKDLIIDIAGVVIVAVGLAWATLFARAEARADRERARAATRKRGGDT